MTPSRCPHHAVYVVVFPVLFDMAVSNRISLLTCRSTHRKGQDPTPALVVGADGKIVCPDCRKGISIGNGGIENFKKRHLRLSACTKRQEKNTRAARQALLPKITLWMKSAAKKQLVPSTVSAPAPVIGYLPVVEPDAVPSGSSSCSPQPRIGSVAAVKPASANTPPDKHNRSLNPSAAALLRQLKTAIDGMPASVPEAGRTDTISAFASTAIPLGLPSDEAWEELDPVLNRFARFGISAEDLALKVCCGLKGMESVWQYISEFAQQYNIEGSLLEGKVSKMISAMAIVYVPSSDPSSSRLMFPRSSASVNARSVSEPSQQIPAVDTTNPGHASMQGPSPYEPSLSLFPETTLPMSSASSPLGSHGVSLYHEDEDTSSLPTAVEETEVVYIRTVSAQRSQCPGYIPVFPPGHSASVDYPFMLHAVRPLPWDYKTQNGCFALRARTCTGNIDRLRDCCHPCEELKKNTILEGIFNRIETGVHENTPYFYYGIGGLAELARRKTDVIDEYRLRRLAAAQKLTRLEGVIDTHKKVVRTIASKRIARVDRVLSASFRCGSRTGWSW